MRSSGEDQEVEHEGLDPTAVHEAGHAVAFARLYPWSSAAKITIEANPEAGYLGLFTALDDVDVLPAEMSDDEAEDHFSRAATYSCAGYGALVALGWSETDAAVGCESDFDSAGDHVDVGKLAAVDLMRAPENQIAVRVVARELMLRRSLAGDHVDILIALADGEITPGDYVRFLQMTDR